MSDHIPSPKEAIILDWETYWDTEYTLKKLSTSEYVRDPRFEITGLAVARQRDRFKPFFLHPAQVQEWLDTIDWASVIMVSHNMHFDGLILAERFGRHPGQYFCTMAASRYLNRGRIRHGLDYVAKDLGVEGKKEGLDDTKGKRPHEFTEAEWAVHADYACHDARLEALAYCVYAPKIPEAEQQLMHETFRMFCDPVLEVDVPLALEALKDAQEQRIERLHGYDLDLKTLRSRVKFPALLRSLGVEPPMKISKDTGKPTFAFAKTDEEFIALLEHHDENVRNVVEAKLESSSNMGVTRALRMVTMGQTGKMLMALHVWGAGNTLRWSGTNKINVQNFKRGGKLRKAIIAPPDHLIPAADQAQIECRLNLWFCGQYDRLDIFATGGDIYNEQASDIYGVQVRRKNGDPQHEMMGFVGKTAVLGLGYQMGGERFQGTLRTGQTPVELPLSECQRIVSVYRESNYMIRDMWETCQGWLDFMANGTGEITYKCIRINADEHKIYGPDGTFLYLPGLHGNRWDGFNYMANGSCTLVNIYGGKLLENIIQWLSRTIIAKNILDIAAYYRGMSQQHSGHFRVVSMTHDEILSCIPSRFKEEVEARVTKIMTAPPVWAPDLPLGVEIKSAPYYCK